MNSDIITSRVSEFFNLKPDELKSATKLPNRLYKHLAIYLCTKHSVCSYETLCLDFGLKSKGSISKAVKNINNLKPNHPISKAIVDIEKVINEK